jgi:hypothetical protein
VYESTVKTISISFRRYVSPLSQRLYQRENGLHAPKTIGSQMETDEHR